MSQSGPESRPSSDSALYFYWQSLPIMIPTDIYIFNWTNPEDVYNETIKPKVQEVGPFRFWQKEKKSNITWNSNGTVTFSHTKYWYYDADYSVGDIDSNVTTVNPIALATARAAKHWSYIVQKTLDIALSSMGHQVHLTHSVRQFLFEGFPDLFTNLVTLGPFYKAHWFDYWEKVGFFYERNASSQYEGVYTMGTGINSSLGVLYKWNYEDHTPFFGGACGKVAGSAGQIYQRNLKQDKIVVFSADLSRFITLKFEEEDLVHGVLGYKFVMDDYTLDNGEKYPENKCFCNGECIPSGVMNLSNTKHDIPLFASLPHFYKADPFYSEAIEGLKPDKKKHEFFITVEPVTGIPLEININIQLNLLLESFPVVSIYQDLPRRYFPIINFQQKRKFPEEYMYLLRTLLMIPTLCTFYGIVAVIGGFCCLIFVIFVRYHRKSEKEYHKEQIVPLKFDGCILNS